MLLTFTIRSILQILLHPSCWLLTLLAPPGDAECLSSWLRCSASPSSGLLPGAPSGSLPISPCRCSARRGIPDWRVGPESYRMHGRAQESVEQIWALQFRTVCICVHRKGSSDAVVIIGQRSFPIVLECVACSLLLVGWQHAFLFCLIIGITTIWGFRRLTDITSKASNSQLHCQRVMIQEEALG